MSGNMLLSIDTWTAWKILIIDLESCVVTSPEFSLAVGFESVMLLSLMMTLPIDVASKWRTLNTCEKLLDAIWKFVSLSISHQMPPSIWSNLELDTVRSAIMLPWNDRLKASLWRNFECDTFIEIPWPTIWTMEKGCFQFIEMENELLWMLTLSDFLEAFKWKKEFVKVELLTTKLPSCMDICVLTRSMFETVTTLLLTELNAVSFRW